MILSNNDLRIEISTKCNYNCLMCVHDQLKRKKEIMNNDLFKLIVDKVLADTDQYDTLSFPGMGEPLLDNCILDKLKYVQGKFKNINILTNGFYLTPGLYRSFEDFNVSSIRISLYANSEKIYKKIHNKVAFEWVKDNILQILKIKGKTKIILTYNIVKENEHETEDWINFWKDKVDLIEVWKPHNWINGKKYRKVNLLERKRSCGRPFNGPLQVQVDGTINMCCFDYNGELLLGDLKTHTLNQILLMKPYQDIRFAHIRGYGYHPLCQICEQRSQYKEDVMIYNSKFNTKKRVNQLSTTYAELKDLPT